MMQLTIALIGNPNTGKSSLFNALCGMRARVGNFPGVTVEKKVGSYDDREGSVTVVDLPGTYSLTARSADEMVSVEVLMGESPDSPPIDVIVIVMDASHLERDFYLLSQLAELDKPMLLVLNMWDCLEENGVKLDVELLSQRLGIPVVTSTANRLIGIDALRAALRALPIVPPPKIANQLFPAAFREEVHRLTVWIHGQGHMIRPYIAERLLLDDAGTLEKRWSHKARLTGLHEQLHAARIRLSQADCRVPSIETRVRHAWVQNILEGIVRREPDLSITSSDRLDRVLAHPWWGLLAFFVLMLLLFQGLFRDLGDYTLTVAIESGLAWLTSFAEQIIAPGAMRSLITDGIIGGVGGVLTFVPQIAVLFFIIAIMEDCGYMARVALIMDRWMSKLGLNGKAFLPLMTSFGCAVPGIMATRTIEHPRDRLVTILIAPLMSCSARLPVYTLLITAFVPMQAYLGGWLTLPGLVFLAMYSLGILVAIPVAWLMKRFYFPRQASPFVIELPRYSLPAWRVVLHRVWEQVWSFITRAGTLILCTSMLLWAAAYFPGDHRSEIRITQQIEALETTASGEDPANRVSSLPAEEAEAKVDRLRNQLNLERSALIEQSFLGRFGKALEPVFRVVGWDWKIGVGVIASFPAREVIIATLGTIYSLGGEIDETSSSLQDQLKAATWPDGRPVFTFVTALSLMVFFALCAQCAATLMIIRQETATWRWPVFTFVYMTSLAYFAAWLVFTIGSWWSAASAS